MKNIVLLKSKPKQGGGLEKVASRIADAFTARGDNVTILSPENKWFKVECFERIAIDIKPISAQATALIMHF